MLSYAISTAKSRASNYLWHLPIDEQEDAEIAAYQRKYLTWSSPTEGSSSSGSGSTTNPEHTQDPPNKTPKLVDEIIASADLYHILGVENQPILERSRLRRAYLSRSRACHPDKFPNDPNATSAFQRVSIAYSILSKPSSRRSYDLHSQSNPSYDVFEHNFASEGVYERVKAEETFKGVVVAAFHEFLDGDLEMIRSLLRTINDLNPALSLTEESINTLLSSLESIRERALTCRTCIYALHSEIARLAELQQAFRNCRYLDLIGRSRITIQLTRTTLSLPVALERALIEQRVAKGMDDARDGVVQEEPVKNVILPKHLRIFIRTLDTVLDTMERVLK